MPDFKMKTAVALGSFDGVHKGHISVLASALQKAETGLLPVCMVFDSHPLSFFGVSPRLITQYEIRDEIITSLGLETKTVEFEKIRNMSGEEFFSDILLKKYNAGAVCCGKNYRFGLNGACTAETMQNLCERNGVEFVCCADVLSGGEPVSSTRVRSLIESGRVGEANRLLTRNFRYRYEVIHGDARGRELGFPTINQVFDSSCVVPKSGVYASRVTVESKKYTAVTNIGVRPTFGESSLRSETHIIGFSGDLYGRKVDVELVDFLREERRFSSAAELTAQMNTDKARSEKITVAED